MTDTNPDNPERIHITLSSSKRERLDELSAQYHNGNVSACVRAAIEAYRLSLQGDSIEAIEKLRISVDKTHEELDELREVIENSANGGVDPQASHKSTQPTTASATGAGEIPSGLKQEIHRYLLDTDDEASLSEICDAVDAESLVVDRAVRLLIKEVDFVKTVEKNGAKRIKLN